MKKINNPLKKRVPREILGEWHKYAVIAIFLIVTIGFVSGLLVANNSMITSAEKLKKESCLEDGCFEFDKKLSESSIETLEAGEKADEFKELLKTAEGDESTKIKEQIAFWKAEKSGNDKKQLPLKILANSFFGGYGSPNVFPFGDILAAEKTTCISRMSLRLMISHFKSIGYEPIVGDSFTADTPLFIKFDKSGDIDIRPVSELMKEFDIDPLGREYDTSEKPYTVLCRSGWVKPNYIYRHKTDKPLYEVSEDNMSVTVTEDHSLFNEKQEKIKPSEVNDSTRLEYYKNHIESLNKNYRWLDEHRARVMARMLKMGDNNFGKPTLEKVPMSLLNTTNLKAVKAFLDEWGDMPLDTFSKTCQAGINFLKMKLYGQKTNV